MPSFDIPEESWYDYSLFISLVSRSPSCSPKFSHVAPYPVHRIVAPYHVGSTLLYWNSACRREYVFQRKPFCFVKNKIYYLDFETKLTERNISWSNLNHCSFQLFSSPRSTRTWTRWSPTSRRPCVSLALPCLSIARIPPKSKVHCWIFLINWNKCEHCPLCLVMPSWPGVILGPSENVKENSNGFVHCILGLKASAWGQTNMLAKMLHISSVWGP